MTGIFPNAKQECQARIAESSSIFLEPRVAVIIHDLINEGITKVGSRVSFNSTSLPLASPVDRLLPSLPSSDSRRLSALHLSHIDTFNLAGIPYLHALIRTGLPSRGPHLTSRYSPCSLRKSPEKVHHSQWCARLHLQSLSGQCLSAS